MHTYRVWQDSFFFFITLSSWSSVYYGIDLTSWWCVQTGCAAVTTGWHQAQNEWTAWLQLKTEHYKYTDWIKSISVADHALKFQRPFQQDGSIIELQIGGICRMGEAEKVNWTVNFGSKCLVVLYCSSICITAPRISSYWSPWWWYNLKCLNLQWQQNRTWRFVVAWSGHYELIHVIKFYGLFVFSMSESLTSASVLFPPVLPPFLPSYFCPLRLFALH